MRAGFVQVYTGEGKGKTTAALGLALRALGAGRRVHLAQFVKHTRSSEHAVLARLGGMVTVRQYGGTPEGVTEGMAELRAALLGGHYGLVIADEISVAVALRQVPLDDLLALLALRPDPVELVITGRWAHPEVVRRADLVTEMREVKHYHRQGVLARQGIEL